jgi:putative transposase
MNKLTEAERDQIVHVCNQSPYAQLPPSQIVPKLADLGVYIASESSYYRVLGECKQVAHRGRSQARQNPRPPATHVATAIHQLWSWDISWLPSTVRGQFYYLYVVEDIFSRFVVAHDVYEVESGELGAQLITRAVIAQGCVKTPIVLHSDNGSPMKSQTMLAKLYELGISPSYSRPRVSNDNAYSEALFRTLKYCPQWPRKGFESLQAARQWVDAFIQWYNYEHCHSGIRFVTPAQRHSGQDIPLLSQRKQVYEAAKARHPQRWSGDTRNWTPVAAVTLNPERTETAK